jgi:hypothetical protein
MRVCSVEKVVRFHRAIGDSPLKPDSVCVEFSSPGLYRESKYAMRSSTIGLSA